MIKKMVYDNKGIKEAYTNILKVCDKYAENSNLSEFGFDDIRDMKKSAKNHLKIVEWSEIYGLNLNHELKLTGENYVYIDDYQNFSYFSDAREEQQNGEGRYISCEDNDKQPLNEWLYKISFSTGAYIFGDDYPKEIFKEFFEELKSHNPKFIDSPNEALYFSLNGAKDIFNNFDSILKKYIQLNIEDRKLRKIKKLEEELKVLKK